MQLHAPGAPPLRNADGVVNYEMYLVNATGAEIPVQVFTRYYGSDSARIQEFTQLAAAQAPSIALSAGQMSRYQATSSQKTTTPQTCSDYWRALSYTDAWTVVGEYHTAPWSSSGYYGYGSTADSNIEVAVQASNGNVSDSGTINISNSNNARYQINEAGVWYGYQIQGLFHYEHDGLYNCYGFFQGVYQDMADYWDGSLRTGAYVGNYDNTPNYWTIKVQAGGQFSTGWETAYTYGGAVSVFGVSLHAQSGFTTSVDEFWKAGSTDGYLYGNGAFPAQSSIIYVATYCPLGNNNCT